MAEFREIIINGFLIGLFIFAAVNFGVFLAFDNSTNTSILDDPEFNDSFGSLEVDLETLQEESQEQLQVQEQDIPTEESESLPLKSIPKMGKAYTGMWRNMWDLTIGLIGKTLGVSPIVMGTFTAILLVSIALLIWAMIRSGR